MKYRRIKNPGAIVFLTLVTHNRQPLLCTDPNIERLRASLRRELSRHPFGLDAIVVLPDHLHMLWSLPAGDGDYQNRVARIKRHFSIGSVGFAAQQSEARENKRHKPVWQRRYWEHTIRDQADYQRHLEYIHYNPVKHGLVQRPADWRFSSIARFIANGECSANWGASEPVGIAGLELE